ncbi:MAG: 4Fe-4S binding protein [Anaerolineaceae bacterium]
MRDQPSTENNRLNFAGAKSPLIMAAVFWLIAIIFRLTTGNDFYLWNFGYIGTALGVGLGLYSILPRRKRWIGRRIAQFLIGSYMLVFLGLVQRENMQIEGFFFYLLAGVFAGAVIHYLVAKVAGLLIFNRGWCGWACWTAMVLDLLPYRRNKAGRLPGRWEWLRYAHFAISLALVLGLWFGVGYRVIVQSFSELWWLLAGNVFYYLSAIVLALSLRDNRAFCKYLCPIPTLQKISSRFALLKIEGDPAKCNDCGACVKACPMDIRVSEYARVGRRVISTECILCFECVDVCTKGALVASFKLDGGHLELLRKRGDTELENAGL